MGLPSTVAMKWIGGGLALFAILFLLSRCVDKSVEAIEENATEKGVQTERATNNAEGIESVEKANAVDNSRDSDFDKRVHDEFCRDCPASD